MSSVNKPRSHRKSFKRGTNCWLDGKEAPAPAEPVTPEKKERKPFYLDEDNNRVTKLKNGAVKPYIEIDYHGDENLVFYQGFFIKKEDQKKFDDMEDDLRMQGHGLKDV